MAPVSFKVKIWMELIKVKEMRVEWSGMVQDQSNMAKNDGNKEEEKGDDEWIGF